MAEPLTIGAMLVICHSILNGASVIQNLSDDWFSVTKDFKSNVDLLRQKVDFYEKEMHKHGFTVDNRISEILRNAGETLKKREEKVLKLDGAIKNSECWYPVWWLYAKLKMIMFPQRLAKTLQKVTSAIDNITVQLKLEAEMGAHFTKWSERKAIPTTIHDNDQLYVPIKQSVQQVIMAIEDTKGPPIILLHGGVGKGKSTLTRYVCQLYGEHGEKKKDNFFDVVHSVSCDNRAIPDPSIKQLEILQHLSPTSFDNSSKNEAGSSKSRIARALYDFFSTQKILIILDDVSDQRFLYEMWKAATGSKHVKYLVSSQRSDLCSSLTKYSLPVRMGDPNEDEAKTILASLVGLEDKVIPSHLQKIAKKLIEDTEGNPLALACLASNFAHSSDKKNKRAWQDAYKSLYHLMGKPQIKIVLGHNHETPPLSAWDALKLCMYSLETAEAKVVLFLIYACEGESVPEEVLRILYDATNMESSTFFKATEELFTRELVKRSPGTLAPEMKLNGKEKHDEDSEELGAWSLPFLVKGYMHRHVAGRKETIRSIISGLYGDDRVSREHIEFITGGLFGDNKTAPEASVVYKHGSAREDHTLQSKKGSEEIEKTAPELNGNHGWDSEMEDEVQKEKKQVAIALCMLYFNTTHIDKALVNKVVDKTILAKALVAKTTLASKTLWQSSTAKNKVREAMEPIIWLMDQPEEDDPKWTEFHVRCARQVFLKFVLAYKLDHCNICLLLDGYPSAKLATLKAMATIFSVEKPPSPLEDSMSSWMALVDLLDSKELNIRVAASKALFHISRKATKEYSTFLVTNKQHVLQKLVGSIQDSLVGFPQQLEAKSAAENAVDTLWELGYSLDVGENQST